MQICKTQPPKVKHRSAVLRLPRAPGRQGQLPERQHGAPGPGAPPAPPPMGGRRKAPLRPAGNFNYSPFLTMLPSRQRQRKGNYIDGPRKY